MISQELISYNFDLIGTCIVNSVLVILDYIALVTFHLINMNVGKVLISLNFTLLLNILRI